MNIQNPISHEPVINSYHDFSGLAALKAQTHGNGAQGKDDKALRVVAQQFEATFIQEMMRTMRQSIMKSDLIESNGMETFEGMFDKEVAMQISKRGGMGVADLMVKHMQPPSSSTNEPSHSLHQALPLKNEAVKPGSYELMNNRLFPLQSPVVLP
jgi:flagellar protein FlgJ